MSLFRRDEAPVDVRLGDINILRMYLDDTLVYDGTRPVLINLPPGRSSFRAPAGAVVIPVRIDLPTATAAANAPPGEVTLGAGVDPPPALALSLAPVGEVRAGVTVDLPAALADSHAPAGSVNSTRIDLPVAYAAALAPAGAPGGGVRVDLPESVAEAVAPAGSVAYGATVDLPPASAESVAPAGEVIAISFLPSGMTKSGATWAATTSYAPVTGWIADPAYPGTVIVENSKLVISGALPNATISASVQLDNTSFLGRNYWARLMRSGSVDPIQEHANVSISSSATPIVNMSGSGIAVEDGETVWVEVRGSTGDIVVLSNPASYVRVVEP